MKVFTYHNIDKSPKTAKLKTLYVKPSQLERQISWLRRLGYAFGRSDDLLQAKQQKKLILTFDDAYLDFWEKALDILRKYNVPAIIFVPAGLVGTYNQWDYQKLNVKKPLMDWWHLRELVKMDIEIGSHSLSHPYLSQISPQKANEEIRASKSLLEDKLSVEIKSFCYPYGDYNPQVRDLVANAGYKLAFTTREGKVEDSPNPFEINRITIFGNDFLPKFLLKVAL
ncbi:MAG: polysaccharide deacetylase family protein [Aquificaceae bacterium]